MGGSLSPVLANLYMENFELNAFNSSNFKPKIFKRYVYDYFVLWESRICTIHQFLIHFNSIHPKIEFKIEIEENKMYLS